MSNTFILKSHAVVSKLLFKSITDFIGEIIDEFSILYSQDVHRDAILEVIEEFLMEQVEDEVITQFNVICDNRNNSEKLAKKGITFLEIRYKQDNCYCTTILRYEITSVGGTKR